MCNLNSVVSQVSERKRIDRLWQSPSRVSSNYGTEWLWWGLRAAIRISSLWSTIIQGKISEAALLLWVNLWEGKLFESSKVWEVLEVYVLHHIGIWSCFHSNRSYSIKLETFRTCGSIRRSNQFRIGIRVFRCNPNTSRLLCDLHACDILKVHR